MRKLFALAGCLAAAAIVLQAADPNYHVVKEIQIGGEGGWDYLIVDPDAHRLYVSHATKVVVADIDTGKIVGEIPDTPGVHGFALAPDLGRGFTSNGRGNSSTIVDLKTLKPLGTVRPAPIRTASGTAEPQRSLDVQSHGRVDYGIRSDEQQGHRDD